MKIIPNFKICTFEKAPIEDGTGNKFWQKTNKSVPFCIEFMHGSDLHRRAIRLSRHSLAVVA